MNRYLSAVRAMFAGSKRNSRNAAPSRRAQLGVELLEQREVLNGSAFSGVIVPAYGYPTTTNVWSALTSAAKATPSVKIEAILDPATGPGAAAADGTPADKGTYSDYTTAVTNFRNAGGKLIGYVDTAYGARSVQAVEQDILNYHNWYKIDGIFLDDMATSAADVSYYQQIYQDVQRVQSGWTVVGNPGTVPNASYFNLTSPTADTLVNFEDTAANYSNYKAPAWQTGNSASHFANIVYGVTSGGVTTAAAVQAIVTQAAKQNTGWIDVTDSESYSDLPSYFGQLLSDVANTPAPTVSVPAAPVFTATAASSTQVNLSWTAVANATGYTVDKLVGTVWTPIATLGSGTTTCPAIGLTAGTSYTFKVGASNSAGTTTFANPQTVALVAPAAPVFSSHSVSGTQINLTWSAVANATGYQVKEWLPSATGTWSFQPIANLGATTSYPVTGLTPGTTYFFMVGASNAVGTTWANYQTVATIAPPAAPVFAAKAASSTQVNLSWSLVANATSYVVEEWVPNSSGTWIWQPIATLSSSSTSYPVPGLNAGWTYLFRVGASNVAGTTWANYQTVIA